MRRLSLFASLFLVPSAAMAGGSDFCLTGAVGASEQGINCASSWVAADGTQLGPVADPRNTPRTPYNTASQMWSGSGSAVSSHSSSANAGAVWQGAAPAVSYGSSHGSSYGSSYASNTAGYGSGFVNGTPTIVQNVPYAGRGQVLVTRGADHNTIYNTGGYAGSSQHSLYSAAPAYIAPLPYGNQSAPMASSSAHYMSGSAHYGHGASYGARSGCFSYGAQGQAQPVACTAVAPAPAPMPYPVTVLQPAPVYTPPVAASTTTSFYNGLNGGVGYNMPVYSGGGGGGVFVSGGSSSVLGRAPILRMRSRNTGKGGGHAGGHNTGCNSGCGSSHGGGHH